MLALYLLLAKIPGFSQRILRGGWPESEYIATLTFSIDPYSVMALRFSAPLGPSGKINRNSKF